MSDRHMLHSRRGENLRTRGRGNVNKAAQYSVANALGRLYQLTTQSEISHDAVEVTNPPDAISTITTMFGGEEPTLRDMEGQRLTTARLCDETLRARISECIGCVNQYDRAGEFPLRYAIVKGMTNIANMLIKMGADVDANTIGDRNYPCEYAIHWAARLGNVSVIQSLASHGSDVNVKTCGRKDLKGTTPLQWAAAEGHTEAVRLLLELGADVNTRSDHERNSPLHSAIKGGHEEAFLLIACEGGVNIEDRDGDGLTALHLCTKHGHYGMVKKLVDEMGADIWDRDRDNATSLHHAAYVGNLLIIRALIRGAQRIDQSGLRENGRKIFAKDRNGRTALHLAALLGHVDAVIEIVRYAKTIASHHEYLMFLNQKDSRAETAMHLAARSGHEVMVKLLACDLLGDVGAVDEHMNTPLHYAAVVGSRPVMDLLVSAGAKVNAKNDKEMTPLHLASERNQVEVVDNLIQNLGAELDCADARGNTPLHCASARGKLDIVLTLARQGALLDAQNKDLMTALHLAVSNRHDEVTKYLVTQLKANPSLQDRNGDTPLHLAVRRGDAYVVRTLSAAMKDTDVVNKLGTTPLAMATFLRKKGKDELLSALCDDEKRRPR